MENIVSFAIIAAGIIVLIMRLFGAWMLRINELIKNQKEVVSILKRSNDIQREVLEKLETINFL